MAIELMQCPYCMKHEGGHGVKMPRSCGAYKISFTDINVLSFKCWKCAKTFRMVLTDDKKYLWDRMSNTERLQFKKGVKQNEKTI